MSFVPGSRERSTTFRPVSPFSGASGRSAVAFLGLASQLLAGYQSDLTKQRSREDSLHEELRKNRKTQDQQLQNIDEALKKLSCLIDADTLVEEGVDEAINQLQGDSFGQPPVTPTEDTYYEVLETIEADSVFGRDETVQPSQPFAQPLLRTPESPRGQRQAQKTAEKAGPTPQQTTSFSANRMITPPSILRQNLIQRRASSSPRAGVESEATQPPAPLQSPISSKALGKRKRQSQKKDEDTEWRPRAPSRKKMQTTSSNNTSNILAGGLMGPPPTPRPAAKKSEERNSELARFYNRDDRAVSMAFRDQSENPVAFTDYDGPTYSPVGRKSKPT